MTIDPQLAVTVAIPTVLGLVWLIRLEGRLNLVDRVTSDLAEDVKYIRDRIDAAINGHSHKK